MTTLAEFRNLVQINLGGRNDSVAVTVIDAAINYAAVLAALVFEPPELKESSTVVANPGTAEIPFSNLTNLLDVIALRNETDGEELWYIPFEKWNIVVPTVGSRLKFYTVFGDVIYLKGTPSTSKTLKVFYTRYPSKLVNNTDSLDFSWHDSYIVAAASGLAMAALEEAESADMWEKVANAVATPLLLGSRARQVIAGQKASFEALLSDLRSKT